MYTLNGTSFIEKYDYNGNLLSVVKTFAPTDTGGGAFASNYIYKMKMAPDNTLYFISGNNIVKYDLSGNLLDTIGNGGGTNDGEFEGVQDFVFIGGGAIQAVDSGTNRLQTFDSNGDPTATITWPKPTMIDIIEDLEIDSDGNYLAVSNAPTKVITKFSPTGTLIYTLNGTENGGSGFTFHRISIALFDSHYYVSSNDNTCVYKMDGSLETLHQKPLLHPTAVTQRADGTTFVAGDNGIHRYSPGGKLVNSFGAGSAHMGIAVDSNNILYVTSVTQAGVLKRYDENDGVLSDISLPSSMGIYGICTDPDSNIFVADLGGIFKVSAGTTSASTFVAGMFTGVTCGRDGSVYGLLYDSGNAKSSIVKYDKNGGIVTAYPNAGAGNYGVALAIAVDKNGKVFVQDGNLTNKIIVFAPDKTTLSPIAPTGIEGLNGNRGMFVDASGNILVADADNHYIKKFSPSGLQLFE